MTNYITTEDFIRGVEELGLRYKRGAFRLYIEDNDHTIANIDLYQPLKIDTCYESLNHKNPTHIRLYELINRYAHTPLDKREKQKKYRLGNDKPVIIKIDIFGTILEVYKYDKSTEYYVDGRRISIIDEVYAVRSDDDFNKIDYVWTLGSFLDNGDLLETRINRFERSELEQTRRKMWRKIR